VRSVSAHEQPYWSEKAENKMACLREPVSGGAEKIEVIYEEHW
jgi:hypothetical protein